MRLDPLSLVGPSGGIRGRAAPGWTETAQTYASSRDAALTSLKMVYGRNVGFDRVIPVAFMHSFGETGFGEDSGDTFKRAAARRLANYGFLCAFVEMRGRDGSSGTQDASGREICDIIDAIKWLRANVPGCDQRRAGIDGYSGGGGNVLAALSKFPTFFTFGVSHFGIADYGYDDERGWYQQTSAGRASMDTWIGDHDDPAIVAKAYRARNALESLPTTLRYSPAERLYLLHDDADTTVSVEHSRAMSAALTAVGAPHTYLETGSGDDPRALHEHPDEGSDVAQFEDLWWRRMANAKPWSLPPQGSARVIGYMCFEAAGRSVEIWAGPDDAPRTSATGGKDFVLDVEWDVVAGTYSVTPLNGTCFVQVVQDDLEIEDEISSTTVLEVA